MRIVVIGREILLKNMRRPIACPEFFGNSAFGQIAASLITAWQIFLLQILKFKLLQNTLIVVIRLVDLFPPQILEGGPFVRWLAGRPGRKLLKFTSQFPTVYGILDFTTFYC